MCDVTPKLQDHVCIMKLNVDVLYSGGQGEVLPTNIITF